MYDSRTKTQTSRPVSSNSFDALSTDWKTSKKAIQTNKPRTQNSQKKSQVKNQMGAQWKIQSNNPSSQNSVSAQRKANIDIFQNYESHKKSVEKLGSQTLNSFFKFSGDDVFCEALDYICKKYSWHCEDWEALNEATNLICDKKIMAHNLKPVCSITFGEPIVTNFSTDFSTESTMLQDIMLPEPIALICEWQLDTGKWTSETVAIMATCKDFWTVIDEIGNNDAGTYSKFALPLLGKENNANEIFSKLISVGKKFMGNDDVVNIEAKNIRNISTIVAQYNSLHPVWSFVKVPIGASKETNIAVPFIRNKDKRAINTLDVNLKDTRNNVSAGINIISPDFSDGYIPSIIMDFIRGTLPKDITAIIFNKTIAVNGSTYFKGYRLRVLTRTPDQASLIHCKSYLESEFIYNISNEHDYSKCVVRISVPK